MRAFIDAPDVFELQNKFYVCRCWGILGTSCRFFFCWFKVLHINLFCSLHILYHYCNEKIFAIHLNPPRIRIPHLTSSWVSKCFKMGPVLTIPLGKPTCKTWWKVMCRTFINQLASESVSHYHKREAMTIAEELSWLIWFLKSKGISKESCINLFCQIMFMLKVKNQERVSSLPSSSSPASPSWPGSGCQAHTAPRDLFAWTSPLRGAWHVGPSHHRNKGSLKSHQWHPGQFSSRIFKVKTHITEAVAL